MLNKTKIKAEYGFDDAWIAKLGESDDVWQVQHGEMHMYWRTRVTDLIAANQSEYEALLQSNELAKARKVVRQAKRNQVLAAHELPATSKHSATSIAYAKKLEETIKALFPKIPPKVALAASLRAAEPYSDRVGRAPLTLHSETTMEDAAYMAVRAHIRHNRTKYDLLRRSAGNDEQARKEARADVWKRTEAIITKWGYVKKVKEEA